MRLSFQLDKYCLALNMCCVGAHFLYSGISSSPLITRCVRQRCASPYTSCGQLWVPYASSHWDYSTCATADVHKWRSFPWDKAARLCLLFFLSKHLSSFETPGLSPHYLKWLKSLQLTVETESSGDLWEAMQAAEVSIAVTYPQRLQSFWATDPQIRDSGQSISPHARQRCVCFYPWGSFHKHLHWPWGLLKTLEQNSSQIHWWHSFGKFWNSDSFSNGVSGRTTPFTSLKARAGSVLWFLIPAVYSSVSFLWVLVQMALRSAMLTAWMYDRFTLTPAPFHFCIFLFIRSLFSFFFSSYILQPIQDTIHKCKYIFTCSTAEIEKKMFWG